MTRQTDQVIRRLRAARAPGEEAAARRAHPLALAAVRTVPARRRRGRRALRALAPLAATLLAAGLLMSPAGADVRDWISDAVTTSQPKPARAVTLPGGGRLLSGGREGLFVRTEHGPRRIFGDVDDATWSPGGLFAAATRGIELIAVSPQGERRWSLHHVAPIRHPRWAPSGLQVAYLSGGALYLVDGNGARDHVADGARAVAPAWRPIHARSELSYVDANGRVVLRDTSTGVTLWRSGRVPGLRALAWSADGWRLLAVSAHATRWFSPTGRLVRTIAAPAGTRNVTATFDRAGHGYALLRRAGRTSRLVLVSGEGSSRSALSIAGPVRSLALSPRGDWYALGVRDSVWLVRPGDAAGLRAVRALPAHGRLMDWCCP